VAGLPAPLLPLQILWVNMVTDTLPALSLAMEPGDADVMQRPPRKPQDAILSRAFLGRICAHGCLIAACTLAAFVSALAYAPREAVTISFMTIALAQIFHLGNARSADAVVHPPRALANRYAVVAAASSIVLQIAPTHFVWLSALLGLADLRLGDWLIVLLFASTPAVVGQAVRLAGASRASATR